MNMALPKTMMQPCKAGGGGASGPSLAVESGAVAWAIMKPENSLTLDGSDNVTAVADLIDGGSYSFSFAGTPHYDADALSTGYPGVELNGVDEYITSTAGVVMQGVRAEYTQVAILKADSTGNVMGGANGGTTSLNQPGYINRNGGTSYQIRRVGITTATAVGVGTPVCLIAKWYLDAGVFKLDLFENGTKIYTGTFDTSNSMTTTRAGWGALVDSSPSNHLTGAYSEVILYDRALSDVECASIYTKAQTDWGV